MLCTYIEVLCLTRKLQRCVEIIGITGLLLLVKIKWIHCLTSRGSSAIARGPPSDIIDLSNRGGGNENGIRMLTKMEVSSTVENWFRKLGLVSGSQSIDRLNALIEFEKFSKLMPGRKPRRIEMIAFGKFMDGKVECLAAVFWHKNTFPAELEVLNILQSPKLSNEKDNGVSMTNFISELCRENSIFPNFTSLESRSHLKNLNYYESLKKYGWDYNAFEYPPPLTDSLKEQIKPWNLSNNSISNLYISLNKSPSLCLDGLTSDIDMGHFWYETRIRHETKSTLTIPLYFRRKKHNEYEISFTRPVTGTQLGSGTVGGALVLSVDAEDGSNSSINVHLQQNHAVRKVVEAIKSKLHHPHLE
mmetsp:Transcript_20002/g.28645  ORF Transcript_20002/g.28645 Transcript_20002/m.28645 type:complete len:360 (+) Transcript_20002:69-1148(+)